MDMAVEEDGTMNLALKVIKASGVRAPRQKPLWVVGSESKLGQVEPKRRTECREREPKFHQPLRAASLTSRYGSWVRP